MVDPAAPAPLAISDPVSRPGHPLASLSDGEYAEWDAAVAATTSDRAVWINCRVIRKTLRDYSGPF
jgi:hypothetical protein